MLLQQGSASEKSRYGWERQGTQKISCLRPEKSCNDSCTADPQSQVSRVAEEPDGDGEDGGEGMEPTDFFFQFFYTFHKIIGRCLTNLLEHLENKLSMHTQQTKQMKK